MQNVSYKWAFECHFKTPPTQTVCVLGTEACLHHALILD